MTLFLAVILASSLYPPAGYDHPYRGKLVIVYESPAKIARDCGKRDCVAWTTGSRRGRCVIHVPNVGPYVGALIRHEVGHCNGWEHE